MDTLKPLIMRHHVFGEAVFGGKLLITFSIRAREVQPALVVPQMNVELVNTGKCFTANFTLPQVGVFLLELELAALLEVSRGDLVAAEQFATARAGKLLPRLDAGVGSLVEPECVRPAQTCKLRAKRA